MANRAYLYSTNLEEIKKWEVPERNYYDSRWDIPMAWWFFFCEKDLKLIKCEFNKESWEELKLIAEKKSAILLFQKRRPILENIVKNYLPDSPIGEFLERIDKWSGKYLVLDASQVFPELDSTDQEHKRRLIQLFNYLDSSSVILVDIIELLQLYSYLSADNQNKYLGSIVGFTYAWTE